MKTKEYINKKLIENGLIANVINPVLESDGLKAYIGDFWFYFGGSEFEFTDPKDISFTTKVDEISLALGDFVDNDEYDDEYLYYYYYLIEHI